MLDPLCLCVPIASAITQVPGGVGPVTIAMLLRSAVDAPKEQLGPRRIDY